MPVKKIYFTAIIKILHTLKEGSIAVAGF